MREVSRPSYAPPRGFPGVYLAVLQPPGRLGHLLLDLGVLPGLLGLREVLVLIQLAGDLLGHLDVHLFRCPAHAIKLKQSAIVAVRRISPPRSRRGLDRQAIQR